jgi:hypothetical protein
MEDFIYYFYNCERVGAPLLQQSEIMRRYRHARKEKEDEPHSAYGAFVVSPED